MELILVIKNGNYTSPFSIHKGASVDCTFSGELGSYPFLALKQRKTRKARIKTVINK